MADFTGARCLGRWWLWDSTEPADHRQAAAECAQCPVIAACRELLHEQQTIAHTLRSNGGGPRGTWAGQLVGKKESGRGVTNPREHATDRGYYQHRWYAEPACDECLIAHRLAERARVGRAS